MRADAHIGVIQMRPSFLGMLGHTGTPLRLPCGRARFDVGARCCRRGPLFALAETEISGRAEIN
jgi:hypothetical protein